MSVDRKNTIEWNGAELSGWIMINGAPTKVSADRDTIHTHARGFDDALTWEINRHRVEIFEKLVPFFQRTDPCHAENCLVKAKGTNRHRRGLMWVLPAER